MRIQLRLIFLLCMIIGLPVPATGSEVVIAKGMAFFEPGHEAVARDKALLDAKREAVEMVIGTSIESRTVVVDFQLSRDQVLSHASGYINSYKIINEKKSNTGTYEIEIEAEVELPGLVSDIDRLQKIITWQKNPRVSVVLSPNLDRSYLPAARKARTRLAKKLKENGFRVFDSTSDSHSKLGLLVKLNLELASSQSDYQGISLQLNEIGMSAEIVGPGSGEILAFADAVKKVPGANRLQALDKGSMECVKAIWHDLRRQLIEQWEQELFGQRQIDMELKNVASYARAMEIIDILKTDVHSVTDVQLIGFADNTADYMIHYTGLPEHLVDELQMYYFRQKYFDTKLEKIMDNRIVLNIL